jgi:hypothetical protein
MAARIDNGRVQVLTRTGLDWTAKYPSAIAALANVNVKTAYLDGELCGVDDAGLPSFAQTQAATDGERGVHLVYYAFDLLHIGGWDVSISPNVASQGEMWTMLMQMIPSADAIGQTECKASRAMGARTFATPVAFTHAATLSRASGSGSEGWKTRLGRFLAQ